jgi:hypothetical protein
MTTSWKARIAVAGLAVIAGRAAEAATTHTINISMNLGNPPSATDPRCAGAVNPAGVTTLTPTLSWTFTDPDAGDTQAAYQVLAGTASADGSVWDSAKVSSSSQSVACGSSLAWGTSYKWKVRLWDNWDHVSDYTPEQTFSLQNPPAVSNLSPLDGAYTNNTAVTFSSTVTAPETGQTAQAEYIIDGVGTLAGSPVTGSGTSSSSTVLAEGTYTWRARAEDQYGALSANSADRTLHVDVTNPATPLIGQFLVNSDGTIAKIIGTAESGTTLTCTDGNGATIGGTAAWDGSSFTFDPDSDLPPGSAVRMVAEDAAGNSSRSSTHIISVEDAENAFRDEGVFHGQEQGNSLRLEQTAACAFNIAANEDVSVTVSAWLRYNSAYGAAEKPRITLSGSGITGSGPGECAVAGGAALNGWERLTVSGTPDSTGAITLKVETRATAAGAAAWIDDIEISQ